MKRLTVAALLPWMAIGAAAQERQVITKTITNTFSSNVMGKVVKGAPYSADEISETTQVLADGTHIDNQSKVTVYRDSEGRVRRDTPTAITIWDPVENVSYELNTTTMVGVKLSMGRALFSPAGTPTATRFYFSTDGAVSRDETLASGRDTAAMLDKLKAEAAANGMTINGNSADPQMTVVMKGQLDAAMVKVKQMELNMEKDAAGAGTFRMTASTMVIEPLGQHSMQGVVADGTRTTSTIAVGEIGNDRPIDVVSERWYSSELQTVVMTRHSDPRTGEETFRLENVSRGEPAASLFMVPPGYQIKEGPGAKIMVDMPAKKE
jgi:hypothetical protein